MEFTREKSEVVINFSIFQKSNQTEKKTRNNANMDLNVTFSDKTYVIEVGVDDTTADLRRNAAAAVGLPEESFRIRFGGKVMDEGADMTQLSSGDTVALTRTKKSEAIAELRALGETDITLQRLESVSDPEVACLLLQAEVATVIPRGFLLHETLTRLDLSGVSVVTHIESNFLSGCSSLTEIDLSSLYNVARIESCFLSGCSSLTEVNLSALHSLTYIGRCFLGGCTKLSAVDFSSLDTITHIDVHFLQGCSSLTSIDLSSLGGVTHIGGYFARECSSLSAIDLPEASVTYVGSNFLDSCRSLTTVNLSSFGGVKELGENFLCGCVGLSAIDLSPLRSVQTLGRGVLSGCGNVKSVFVSGCSDAVSSALKRSSLGDCVMETRPKRSRDEDEGFNEACKRCMHSQ